VVVVVVVVVVGGMAPIVMVTVLPAFVRVPPLGLWRITRPALLGLVTVTTSTERPASRRLADADDSLAPTTSGTVTCFGPEDTTSVIADPRGCGDPAGGTVRIT
jgi:hypothetical protein